MKIETDGRSSNQPFGAALQHHKLKRPLLFGLIGAVVAVLAVWQCGVRIYTITGLSGYPNIQPGDMVAVNLASYGMFVPLLTNRVVDWSSPQRNEIVLIDPPATVGPRIGNVQTTRLPIPLFKRVVGLPGDEIELRDNRLFVNNEPMLYSLKQKVPLSPNLFDDDALFLATEYGSGIERIIAVRSHCVADLCSFGPVTVPLEHYFLLGDNRDFSVDSRQFGPVHKSRIIGRFAGRVNRRPG
jgi:signal peptidase I